MDTAPRLHEALGDIPPAEYEERFKPLPREAVTVNEGKTETNENGLRETRSGSSQGVAEAMESHQQILDEIYPADWFERVKRMEQHSAVCMAETIFERLRPMSVLDLGCGPGIHANRLAEAGCQVTAVDGTSHAAQFIRPEVRFVQADLRYPLDLQTKFDAVLCLEVAEHLPESAADTLCRTLVRHTGRWLVFTAAPPGQEGRDHINLKPMEYWSEKLSGLGLQPRRRMAAGWRKSWRARAVKSYFCDNLMIFETLEEQPRE